MCTLQITTTHYNTLQRTATPCKGEVNFHKRDLQSVAYLQKETWKTISQFNVAISFALGRV